MNVTRRECLGSMSALAAVGCTSWCEGDATLPERRPGEMDIHFIHTGVGEQTFFVFSDGTTMLLDCGDTHHAKYMKDVPPRPDSTRYGGEWTALVHCAGDFGADDRLCHGFALARRPHGRLDVRRHAHVGRARRLRTSPRRRDVPLSAMCSRDACRGERYVCFGCIADHVDGDVGTAGGLDDFAPCSCCGDCAIIRNMLRRGAPRREERNARRMRKMSMIALLLPEPRLNQHALTGDTFARLVIRTGGRAKRR